MGAADTFSRAADQCPVSTKFRSSQWCFVRMAQRTTCEPAAACGATKPHGNMKIMTQASRQCQAPNGSRSARKASTPDGKWRRHAGSAVWRRAGGQRSLRGPGARRSGRWLPALEDRLRQPRAPLDPRPFSNTESTGAMPLHTDCHQRRSNRTLACSERSSRWSCLDIPWSCVYGDHAFTISATLLLRQGFISAVLRQTGERTAGTDLHLRHMLLRSPSSSTAGRRSLETFHRGRQPQPWHGSHVNDAELHQEQRTAAALVHVRGGEPHCWRRHCSGASCQHPWPCKWRILMTVMSEPAVTACAGFLHSSCHLAHTADM